MKPLFLQHFVPKDTQVHTDRTVWYFKAASGDELIVTKHNVDQGIDRYYVDWGETDLEVEEFTALGVYQQVELFLLTDEKYEEYNNRVGYNDRDDDEF